MPNRKRGKRHKPPTDALNGRLEKLRAILYAGPTRNTWHELGEFLDTWPDDNTLPMGLTYAASHLSDWPDDLCANRGRAWQWMASVLAGERNPRAALVRHARFRRKSFPGVEPLASSADVARLRSLDDVRIGPSGLKKLTQGQPWPALEHLDLSANWLQDRDVEALSLASTFPRLRTLRLNENPISAAAVALLLSSPTLPDLEGVELAGCAITTVTPILEAPRPERLLAIDLSNNKLALKELLGLLSPARYPRLERLGLVRVGMVSTAAVRGLLPNLTELRLGQNAFGDVGVRQLFEGVEAPRLEVLDLSGCKLSDRAIESLMQTTLPETLVELRLATNRLTSVGAMTLATRPWPRLTTLDLASNDIGDEGGRALTQASAPSLTALGMRGNNLSPLGVVDVVLAETLSEEARHHMVDELFVVQMEGGQVDATSLLRVLAAPTLSDASLAHLVEHLPPTQLVQLAHEPDVDTLLTATRLPRPLRETLLSRMTVSDLLNAARRLGLPLRSRLRRAELIEHFEAQLFGEEG